MRNREYLTIKTVITSLVIVLAIVIMCITSQCSYSRKSNEKKGSGVVVLNVQWNDIIDTEPIPETLRYCLYPSGNGAMIQMEGNSLNFKITLPPDTYRLLIFNADDRNVRLKGMSSYDSAKVYLVKHGEDSHKPAPPLYGASIEELIVMPQQTTEIDLLMKPLVQRVHISVNVENGENIQFCDATLTGVVLALNLSTNYTSEESTKIPFRLTKNKKGFEKSILLLDAALQESRNDTVPNLLTINFTLKNGSMVSSTVDLGSALQEYDRQNIEIELNAETKKLLSPSFVFSDYIIRPMRITSLSLL